MRENNSAMRDICGAYAGSVGKYMGYAELMQTPSKVADICEWACAPHVCMKVYKRLPACMQPACVSLLTRAATENDRASLSRQ